MASAFDGVQNGDLRLGFTVNDHTKITNAQINNNANARVQEKIVKYGDACTRLNKGTRDVTLVPFVYNTTGKIHPLGMGFLKKVAEHAVEARGGVGDSSVFLNYYLKLFSVSLMKHIARTVNAKAKHFFARNLQTDVNAVRRGNMDALEEAWDPRSFHYHRGAD